jgi:hypothetical protein
LKSRVPVSYTVYVLGGMFIGLFFGDKAFPQFEAAFGDPVTDIVLGVGGAVFAAVAYEVLWPRRP